MGDEQMGGTASRLSMLAFWMICGLGGDAHAQEIRDLAPAVSSLAEPFSRVTWVRELRDGRVIVPDELERAVYEVRPGGGRRMLGARGQGPGEYIAPRVALPLPGDSTLVFDARQARYLVIAPDGEVARTFSLISSAPRFATQTPRATDTLGRIYLRERDGGTMMIGSGGTGVASVIRYDPRSGRVTILGGIGEARGGGHIPVGEPVRSGNTATQVIVPIPHPWVPEDAWGVLDDGSVAIIRSEPVGVSWSDGSQVHLGLTGRPVRSRDREAFYQAWLEEQSHDGNTEQLAALMPIRRIEWPERTSPFSGREAHADGVGRLWLRVTGPEVDRTEYVVFDRTSVRLRVRLPAGGRVVGFGDGRVWVGVTDELGQVYLSAHPLP